MSNKLRQPISRLQCIACGHDEPTTTARFRCSTCGDLLAVQNAIETIADTTDATELKKRFAKRQQMMTPWESSGVWRYRELILPDLPNDMIVSLSEGNTGLYTRDAVTRFVGCAAVHLKHEGENPTLSFKDRGMTAGVSWAHHVGAKRVACASTGDTSAAMAAYAASAGIPAVVLLPHNKVSLEQLAQPISYGAQVLALDTDFDGCMMLVQKLTDSGEIYLLNSMNPFRIEGQKAIGIEILHQLNWDVPDWIVIPVGNAGNITALGKGLIELRQLGVIDRVPRLAGVQVDVANPLSVAFAGGFKRRERTTAGETIATAIRIGDPVSFEKAKDVLVTLDGVVTEVGDSDAMHAKAVCDGAGVHICPNSGVAVAGARRLRQEGVINAGDRVVVIATAHGSKFSTTTMPYHTDGRWSARRANPPARVPASLDHIRRALDRTHGR